MKIENWFLIFFSLPLLHRNMEHKIQNNGCSSSKQLLNVPTKKFSILREYSDFWSIVFFIYLIIDSLVVGWCVAHSSSDNTFIESRFVYRCNECWVEDEEKKTYKRTSIQSEKKMLDIEKENWIAQFGIAIEPNKNRTSIQLNVRSAQWTLWLNDSLSILLKCWTL